MAIKRRKENLPGQSQAAEEPDENQLLMEQLLRKTLAVNPSIKDGKSTAAVMEELRKQAVLSSRSGQDAAQGRRPGTTQQPAGPTELTMQERRMSTISYFFDQKDSEYRERDAQIRLKEEAIKKERQQLRIQFLEAIADFFSLMHGGAETPEAKNVMRKHAKLLSTLTISEADLIRRTREKMR